jgi:uncharacterized protein (TIGR02594 family)
MPEPKWIALGRSLIGLHEIPGVEHSPEIVSMWKDIKRSGIKNDETPWCAAFVGAMLERAGIQSSRFESAASYLNWGNSMASPVYGCVAVFSRQGGGHVGFVVGRDADSNLLVLGGNQGDAVNIKAFSPLRVTGYRWPDGIPLSATPLIIGSAETSKSEA